MTATEQDFTTAGRYRDALAAGEFRAMLAALVVMMLGQVMSSVALTVLIYQRTGSPLLSALTFTMTFLPYLVGGTLGSGLVDRLPPRRLLMGCSLAPAGLVAVMALPGLPTAALLGLLFGAGLSMPVAAGVRGALLPEMLPPGAVVPARSLLRLVAQAGQVVGYGAGGGLLAGVSPRAMLLVDAAALVGSAVVLGLGLRRRSATPRAKHGDGPPGGVRAVLALGGLRRVLLLGGLVPFFAVTPEALAAPSVADLGLPVAATGWWLTALPIGMIVGEVVGVWLLPPRWRPRLVRPLAAASLVPLVLFLLHPGFGVALALLASSGLCAAYLLGVDQLMLAVTPPRLRGRAYAVASAWLMSAQGIGFAVAGAVGEFMSPSTAIAIAGLAGLAVVATIRLPSGGSTSVGDQRGEPGEVDLAQ